MKAMFLGKDLMPNCFCRNNYNMPFLNYSNTS